MGELEQMPFNEMTDRELIIKLYARMDNMADDINEIKQSLKDRPCPSQMCKAHHDDIERLKYRNQIMAWAFGSALTIIGLGVALLAVI